MMGFSILRYAIAAVWLTAGLWCKILNGVPRHQQIVSRILGSRYAVLFTKAIGWAEVGMAVWVASHYQPEICAVVQAILIVGMNIIELGRAKDLLLFGRANFIIALLFTAVILWSSFVAH